MGKGKPRRNVENANASFPRLVSRLTYDSLILVQEAAEQIVHFHVVLTLDVHAAAPLEVVALAEHRYAVAADLDSAGHAGRVHAARDVHRVAPDVVVQLAGADHAGRHVAEVVADAHDQVELEQVAVERFHHLLHGEGEVEQRVQVLVVLTPAARVETGRGHERAADRLDLLHAAELGPGEQLVEVADQLVQHAQVLLAAEVRLVVHLVEVDDAGEDDADVMVVLRVLGRVLQLLRHVLGDDVVQQHVRLVLHVLHAYFVLVGDRATVEAKAVADLEFAIQKPHQHEQQKQIDVDLDPLLNQSNWARCSILLPVALVAVAAASDIPPAAAVSSGPVVALASSSAAVATSSACSSTMCPTAMPTNVADVTSAMQLRIHQLSCVKLQKCTIQMYIRKP
uniref:Uncharacterized protein n=1 Tax=Anopheles atroparvus TaxID=41427 RepID=A0A182J3C9_ANOAO